MRVAAALPVEDTTYGVRLACMRCAQSDYVCSETVGSNNLSRVYGVHCVARQGVVSDSVAYEIAATYPTL